MAKRKLKPAQRNKLLLDRLKYILIAILVIVVLSLPVTIFRSCAGNTKVVGYPAKGLDISSWQKEVDFKALSQTDVSFVILRVGSGLGKDSKFEEYYRDAKRAGLNIGCYYYTYAKTTEEAEKDAKNVLDWIGNKKFQYPIYFDIEDDTLLSLSTEKRTEICRTFLDKMKSEDYLVGIYSNTYWFTSFLDKSLMKDYEVWLAHWSDSGKDDMDMSEKCGLWQYTSTGKVDGISMGVDLDISYVDYPDRVKRNGQNGYRNNPDVTEALSIGSIWKSASENTDFYTGYSSKSAKIGKISPDTNLCILETKNVNGTLWGKTAVKGVKGWLKLKNATEITKTKVYVLQNGNCEINSESKEIHGIVGTKESVMNNIFVNNILMKLINDSDNTSRLSFVYNDYVISEYKIV